MILATWRIVFFDEKKASLLLRHEVVALDHVERLSVEVLTGDSERLGELEAAATDLAMIAAYEATIGTGCHLIDHAIGGRGEAVGSSVPLAALHDAKSGLVAVVEAIGGLPVAGSSVPEISGAIGKSSLGIVAIAVLHVRCEHGAGFLATMALRLAEDVLCGENSVFDVGIVCVVGILGLHCVEISLHDAFVGDGLCAGGGCEQHHSCCKK